MKARHARARKTASRSSRSYLLEGLESRMLLSADVLTWHNDLSRDGLNANETVLTPANVNPGTFGKLFTYPVDGQVYAQPLYVSNLTIPGQGTHNVVYVATENDSVYAFDANSNGGANGGLLWHVSLGTAAATPNNDFGNRYGPYHDINPKVGITGTPVIDLASNTMYVDAFTHDGTGLYSHHIHALDLTTGADKITPQLVTASVPGNGAGSSGGQVSLPGASLQRPALTLLNGTLYVVYGGFADTDPYHGWVLGFNPQTLQLTSAFNTTPNYLPGGPGSNAGEGGIWQSGNGLSSDGSNLYFITGNGDFDPAVGDYGDSTIKLSTANGTLSVSDYFTPQNQQALSNADEDFGSGGTLLLPASVGSAAHPNLMIACGKEGTVYLIDRGNMGKFNASKDNVVQEVSLGHGTWSNPAYFNGQFYYSAVGDSLKAFSIANGVMSPAPVSQSTTTYAYPGGTPSISADGNTNGIVWDIEASSSGAAVLHAYDATNVARELYNSTQSGTRDTMGSAVKFTTPTIADGEVFVANGNAVSVFGLLAVPTSPPAAPTGLTVTPLGASGATLRWTDNANNETAFKIFRSTDGVNFAQIGLAGANVTTFTDSGLNPQTTYYYEVSATNPKGDSAFSNVAKVTTGAPDAPVDVYPFDEGSGSTTADIVGGNNGTLIGTPAPQWVAGRIGPHALSFSGSGAPMTNPSQSAVQTTQDLEPVLGGTSTLAAWIKTTQVGNDALYYAPAITGVEQAGLTDDVRFGYLDGSGHIGVGAGNGPAAISTSPVNNGQWHHVAFTRDANTGVVQVYVDGQLSATATGPTGQITSHFNLIGAQSDVAGDGVTFQGASYLNGQLDDVRIYNAVLSAGEIASLGEVPPAIVGLSAVAASGSVVQLNWNAPAAYASSVEVDRAPGSGGTFVPIATLPAGSTSYMDAGLTPGATYTYRVIAIDAAGPSAASASATVTTLAPTVLGELIFYNNSSWDGQNGTSNIADDRAIATDKQVLLPGQVATYQNVTDYSKGINGLMIDVANLSRTPTALDFIFKAGADPNPLLWTDAPAPSEVNVYPGRGANGSTRIELLWDDGTLVNTWLRVTMLADANTGIAAPATFYVGNLVGYTGHPPVNGWLVVGPADVMAVQNEEAAANPVAPGITDPQDINRDKVVDGTDLQIVRGSVGHALPLIDLSANGINATPGVANTITLRRNADGIHDDVWINSPETGAPTQQALLGQTITINSDGQPDTLVLDPSNGAPLGGKLILNGTFNGPNPLTIGPNQVVALGHSFGANSVLNVPAVSIDPAGTLDLDNNTLKIAYGNGSDANGEARFLVLTARDNGKWDGPGITSADAAASPGTWGVGWLDDPTTHTETVRATLLGDANLDGKVDVVDLGVLATHFGQPAYANWWQGDFSYDSGINVVDLGLLATNFGKSVTQSSAAASRVVAAAAPRRATFAPTLAPRPAGP